LPKIKQNGHLIGQWCLLEPIQGYFQAIKRAKTFANSAGYTVIKIFYYRFAVGFINTEYILGTNSNTYPTPITTLTYRFIQNSHLFYILLYNNLKHLSEADKK